MIVTFDILHYISNTGRNKMIGEKIQRQTLYCKLQTRLNSWQCGISFVLTSLTHLSYLTVLHFPSRGEVSVWSADALYLGLVTGKRQTLNSRNFTYFI
jgi:hypothetical protein